MQDVANHAGVSTRTVSNVVNNYVHVSPELRERVQQSLGELGYKMDYMARGLRRGKTGFVALAVPYFSEPYFAGLAQAVIAATRRRGLIVLVEATHADPDIERAIVNGSLSTVADGVLLSGASARARSTPAQPLVMLGEHAVAAKTPMVGIDNVEAAATATRHLISSGRRRIVALGIDDSANARMRWKGYSQALATAGLTAPTPLGRRATMWSPELGYELAGQLLKGRGERPDGIFAFNDSLAIGVLRALEEHSIRVPDDVAVVGFDNIVQSAYTSPSLTTIAPDLDLLADRAVELLLSSIGPNSASIPRRRQHFTPYRLVARESAP